MVSLKTDALAHLERFGDARMFRVPVAGAAAEQRASFARAVNRQLDSLPYDIVHVRGPFEGEVVARRRRELGCRFVYEVATYPDEAESADAERRWGEAHDRCLEDADLIVVPTAAAARSLGDRGFAGKVAVVPPGVDVNRFDWWPISEGEETRILCLASFAADRDMGTVLTALRALSQGRRIRALIAGEPDPGRRERLRTIVESFRLGEVVQVRGEPLSEAIPSLIAAAHVAVVPASATPRFQELGDIPQPVLEYMACRRPLVAAGVPGVAEVVRDEKEGLLYVPGDDSSLADGISTLIEQSTLRERLVEASYDRVRWNFSGGARRRRIAEVYEMLLGGSQSYDAWVEAFSADASGQLGVPSSVFEMPGSSSFSEVPTAESTLPPTTGSFELPERPPSSWPARSAEDRSAEDRSAEDTHPAIEGEESGIPTEMPPSPTRIEPPRTDTDPGLRFDEHTPHERSPAEDETGPGEPG